MKTKIKVSCAPSLSLSDSLHLLVPVLVCSSFLPLTNFSDKGKQIVYFCLLDSQRKECYVVWHTLFGVFFFLFVLAFFFAYCIG